MYLVICIHILEYLHIFFLSLVLDIKYHPSVPDIVYSGSEDGSIGFSDLCAGNVRLPVSEQFQHVLESRLAVNCLDIFRAMDVLVCGTDDGVLMFKQISLP